MARVLLSLLGAGACYFLWMILGIPAARASSAPLSMAVFALAPVATATGFALGTRVGEVFTRIPDRGFLAAWVPPLIACSIGAAAVYPFGPMLIVFGMFVLGLAAVVLRELRFLCRAARGE